MKKIIVIFCIACISASVIAQQEQGVRIGSYVFHVQKADPDNLTNVYVEEDPCPPCPQNNETQSKPRSTFNRYHSSDGFIGIGFIHPENFIQPNDGAGYYMTRNGNSFNLELGQMRRYHLTRRFALGSSLQYSFYNYRLNVSDPVYLEEVFKNTSIEKDDIYKQVFRSHNLVASAFTRFYLIPPKNRGNDGLYVDLGAQGDFAFSKYCKIKTHANQKYKFRDTEAFHPFHASAIARVGWNRMPIPGFKSGAIFARYRLTDAFNSKVLPMDLPPITIGIQLF